MIHPAYRMGGCSARIWTFAYSAETFLLSNPCTARIPSRGIGCSQPSSGGPAALHRGAGHRSCSQPTHPARSLWAHGLSTLRPHTAAGKSEPSFQAGQAGCWLLSPTILAGSYTHPLSWIDTHTSLPIINPVLKAHLAASGFSISHPAIVY